MVLGVRRDVCNLKNVLPSLGCHSSFDQSSSFRLLSCALTDDVIDLFILRQCFGMLTNSTET